MSINTVRVDQFLINKLQPEIDVLNLSLVSMEEYGYSSKPILDTRRKLNKLITVYDFLKEYAYGDEELDTNILNKILELIGSDATSNRASLKFTQSSRTDITLNIRNQKYLARIYKNDEVLLSNTLTTSASPINLSIYGNTNIDKIEITLESAGIAPQHYEGHTHVTIRNISTTATNAIVLKITMIKNNTIVYNEEHVLNIMFANCTSLSFWSGATSERFTISNDLNESSTITIDPNSGSNQLGIRLTHNWIIDNFSDREVLFRGDSTRVLDINLDDTHGIILIPTTLEVININELVDVDLQDLIPDSTIPMQEHIHYDKFSINSDTERFTCIYFRDLTNTTFPERHIQFTIKKI